MNPGKNTINWLKNEQLRIDPEWMIETPKGLTWWADQHAQHIEVTHRETGPDGDVADYVRIRTELLKNCDLTPKTEAALNMLMTLATMSGPVYLKESRSVELCCSVRIHEGIRGWMAPLLSVAAMLQIQEVRNAAGLLGVMADGDMATSGHPVSGMREEPDELVEGFGGLLKMSGGENSKWNPAEFQSAVDKHMQAPPSLGASAGGAGLTVEFPYGDFSSLCQLKADEKHPVVGNGLFLRQTYPFHDLAKEKTIGAALAMNKGELFDRPAGYGFGSYLHDGSCLHYTMFIPNAAYRPGLLPNLYYACATRACALSTVFTKNDWSSPGAASAQSKPRPKSALERMMDFFK